MINQITKNSNSGSSQIMNYLNDTKFKEQLKSVLPQYLKPERMVRIALTELRISPRLAETNPLSFIGAIIRCAQMGLEPSSERGHVYLIPFKNECKVMIGYKGMLYLAAKSNVYIETGVVYENDIFEYTRGLTPTLKHTPALRNKGNIVGVYALARLLNTDFPMFEFMNKEEIDEIMVRAAQGKSSTPWQTDYEAMARKTVIRRLFKYLPLSDEIQHAVTIDEKGEMNAQNNALLVDELNEPLISPVVTDTASQNLLSKLQSNQQINKDHE